MEANKKKDVLRMLTHRVTRVWVLILRRSLELFFRELAVSGAATQDKHRVPDGKLLERNKKEHFSVKTPFNHEAGVKGQIQHLEKILRP